MRMKFQYDNQFYKLANKINMKKYRLLGIKNPEILEKLVDLDAEYFTHMFLHRNNFDKELDRFFEKIPFEDRDDLK